MSKQSDRQAALRAANRASWPVHTYRLGAEPSDDLSASTTPEQRLAMMWPLAVEAWSLAGRPMPDYPRSRIPVRIVRPVDRDARPRLNEESLEPGSE